MPAAANRRAHLSIGEVLSLLQEEFPDVTISKIRFLESQGLLDPERTPSGYRKFYDYDIERLRWILRLQKDHYLPLKVIKDRLDAGEGAPDGVPGTRPSSNGAAPTAPEATAADRAATAPAPSPSPSERRTPSSRGGREAAGTGRRQQSLPGVSQGDQPATAQPSKVTSSGAPGRGRAERSAPAARNASSSRGGRAGGGSDAGRRSPAGTPPPAAPARNTRDSQRGPADGQRRGTQASQAGGEPRARQAGTPPPTAATERASTTPAFEPGADAVSLSIDELAEASGLSLRDVRDLERFGLIEPRPGTNAYDGDALIVARTAAGFLQHGIEARHMRTYKVAVDREAGLFQQIVSPVLKQRNPEARTRAARTVTELIRLGEVMRGVLLRRELRDHLGGG